MQRILPFLATAIILISCDSGKKFEGKWTNTNDNLYHLTITNISGKDFKVVEEREAEKSSFDAFIPPDIGSVNNMNFSLEDGKLVGPMNFSIVYSDGKLVYNGKEYEKK